MLSNCKLSAHHLIALLQQDNGLLVDGVVIRPAYRSTPVEAERLEQASQRTKVDMYIAMLCSGV